MFQKTSERLSHVERVASHATKEHASGRIDMIPANAQQPVDYFNALYDQYKILGSNYKLLTSAAAVCRGHLEKTMRHEDYHRVHEQYSAICADLHRIEEQFAELRPLIRAARDDAREAFMWHMAKTILQQEDVRLIENQCARFAETNLEIPKGLEKKSIGEKQGEAHEARKQSEKRQKRRQGARRNLELAKQEGLVMYANSQCRQGDKPQRYSIPAKEIMPKRLQMLADHFNKR